MASKSIALDRIKRILDDGSFVEMQSFIATSVVTGYGQINGRLVYIFSEDKNAGAFDSLHAEKISRLMEACLKVGAPIIGIYDSKGADINGNLDTLDGYGLIFSLVSKLSGVVPQISIVVSDLIGSEAIAPMLSDFVFKIKGKNICMNGSNVTGLKLVNDDCSEIISENEDKCFLEVKKLISLLPQNYMEGSEDIETFDDLNRKVNDVTDVNALIKEIVDSGDLYEIKKDVAVNVKTVLARLGGMTVGIVANDSKVNEGRIDIKAAKKISKFVSTCDAFNIPLLTMVDTKGYTIDKDEENKGLVREVSHLTYVYSIATVPMVTLVIGEAIGNAYVSMGSKHLHADMVYAYPDSKLGIITKEAAERVYAGDNSYDKKAFDVLNAAKKGFVDAIIEKADTRQILISTFDSLATKYVDTIGKKHSTVI